MLLGLLDVGVLAFFGAATEQDNQHVAILPNIDAIPGPEIDAVFSHALANRFHVGEVPLFHAIEPVLSNERSPFPSLSTISGPCSTA